MRSPFPLPPPRPAPPARRAPPPGEIRRSCLAGRPPPWRPAGTFCTLVPPQKRPRSNRRARGRTKRPPPGSNNARRFAGLTACEPSPVVGPAAHGGRVAATAARHRDEVAWLRRARNDRRCSVPSMVHIGRARSRASGLGACYVRRRGRIKAPPAPREAAAGDAERSAARQGERRGGAARRAEHDHVALGRGNESFQIVAQRGGFCQGPGGRRGPGGGLWGRRDAGFSRQRAVQPLKPAGGPVR